MYCQENKPLQLLTHFPPLCPCSGGTTSGVWECAPLQPDVATTRHAATRQHLLGRSHGPALFRPLGRKIASAEDPSRRARQRSRGAPRPVRDRAPTPAPPSVAQLPGEPRGDLQRRTRDTQAADLRREGAPQVHQRPRWVTATDAQPGHQQASPAQAALRPHEAPLSGAQPEPSRAAPTLQQAVQSPITTIVQPTGGSGVPGAGHPQVEPRASKCCGIWRVYDERSHGRNEPGGTGLRGGAQGAKHAVEHTVHEGR